MLLDDFIHKYDYLGKPKDVIRKLKMKRVDMDVETSTFGVFKREYWENDNGSKIVTSVFLDNKTKKRTVTIDSVNLMPEEWDLFI